MSQENPTAILMSVSAGLHDSIVSVDAQVLPEQKNTGVAVQAQATVETTANNLFSTNEEQAGGFTPEKEEYLKKLGFTLGLIKALGSNYKTFKKRVWLVDNSGSMKMTDGTKIEFYPNKCNCFGGGGNYGRTIPVSRWEELQACVEYHVDMAAELQIPTTFRLLNAPDRKNPNLNSFFDIGMSADNSANVDQSRVVMNNEPKGPTPLALHLRRLRSDLEMISRELEESGQKVVIIIATDGIPTNERGYTGKEITQDFVNALNNVYNFPVWVVFRLCTNNQEILEYYNGLDLLLERPVEVLNDFMDESLEVHKCNPWINYCQPIHRCREFGFHHRLFDLMDERPLTLDEAHDYCCLIFGQEFKDTAPEPQADFKVYAAAVEKTQNAETPQWNPCSKSVKPWINMELFRIRYGDGTPCSIL